MKGQSLFLIFTPIDRRYKDADTHYSPSLSLVSLKNYLSKTLPELSITLLDGSVVFSKEAIIERIERERPDFVGQSIQLISYANALEIADAAKRVGATTVVGGHQATQLRREIATNREGIIDYVVFGDGEIALYQLLCGQDIRTIPNLAYSRNGIYQENEFSNTALTALPITDYSGIDLKPYQKLLAVSPFNTSSSKTYLRVYSHKGCGNRGNSDACVFCGRADVSVRFKPPSQYWSDLRTVVEINGADYVMDVGDDFLARLGWLKQVVSSKPEFARSYSVGVYGRANRITAEKARLLKLLNVTDVVIGFETGDPDVMARVGKKHTSVRTSVEAAKCLFEENIDVCASFVLGLPGESERSLEATIKIAGEIAALSKKIRRAKPREMVANLLEPSPGSPAYKRIVERFPEKYAGADAVSLEEIQYDYFRTYFNISNATEYEKLRDKLREAARHIHALVDFSDSQGWLGGEVSTPEERTS